MVISNIGRREFLAYSGALAAIPFIGCGDSNSTPPEAVAYIVSFRNKTSKGRKYAKRWAHQNQFQTVDALLAAIPPFVSRYAYDIRKITLSRSVFDARFAWGPHYISGPAILPADHPNCGS